MGSLFKERVYPPQITPAIGPALPEIWKTQQGIKSLSEMLLPKAEEAYRRAYQFATSPLDLTSEDQLRRREREAIMPTLAARGVATSAPGIWGELEAATKASEGTFQRETTRQAFLQQALQGLAQIQSLPVSLQSQLASMILGAPIATPTVNPSILGRIFGGQGVGGYSSSGTGANKSTSGSGLLGLISMLFG